MATFKSTDDFTESKDVDTKDFIIGKVDGDDYGRGSIEAARQTADNAGQVLGNLIELLQTRGILKETDIEELTAGTY